HGNFVGRTAFQPAAVIDVFTFAVFADHDEVDVGRALVSENAADAGIELRWTDAGVLIERLTDFYEGRQRDVVRNKGGPADGAEEDRVHRAQNLEEIVGNDGAVLLVVFDAPREVREIQLEGAVELLDLL